MAGRETIFRWIPARPRPYTVTLMGPLMDAAGEEIIGHFLEERPARVSRSGNVRRKSGATTTSAGEWNAPTRFLAAGKSTPVLPPHAASTIASSVVGTWTNAMPRR